MFKQPDQIRGHSFSSRSGFTLMEVLLSIAMVSLIMVAVYSTLFATIDARDQIEKKSLEARFGPSILNMIEKDVSGVWCMNIHENDVFIGEEKRMDNLPSDCFHMITTTDSTLVEPSGEEDVRSDLSEVSYIITMNPRIEEKMELWRRQDFHVDDEISEGGKYERIYERIESFDVRYYEDIYEGAEALEEWDTKEMGRLPAAMEIVIQLQIDPKLAGMKFLDAESWPSLEFRRVIFFPADTHLTMAVRPVIPTFVKPGGSAGSKGDPGGTLGPGGESKGSSEQMSMTAIGEDGKTKKIEKGGDHKMPPGGFPKPPPGGMPPNMKPPVGGEIDLTELMNLLKGL